MGQEPDAIRQDIEQTRAEMGETVEAIGYKADVPARAKEKVADKVDAARSKVSEAASRAKEAVSGTAAKVGDATPSGGQVKRRARQAAGLAQENPLGLAIGAAALGFLAGRAVPSTRVEDERLGPVADQVKDQVKETGQETLERGRQVAQDAAQTVRERGQEQGQDLAASARQGAREVRDQASPS
jgi:hypothetical protein